MYGAGVGTGAAGGGLALTAVSTGSMLLGVVVAVLLAGVGLNMIRIARRRAASQRP